MKRVRIQNEGPIDWHQRAVLMSELNDARRDLTQIDAYIAGLQRRLDTAGRTTDLGRLTP